MADSTVRERFERNASGIAATAVTGTWLAALLLDVDWWLPLMLFGYIVVVPVVAMLFDADEDEEEEKDWDETETRTGDASDAQAADAEPEPERTQDALDRLRTRYAEGELTDEQFERKLDRLLATETPEDAAEYVRRDRPPERDVERER
ncbi:SHOCT domain-containing protein [Halorubrum sp. HHNYT27]|uniref:SHOCT domain-containing protein n=1 Tax=Halorubrum sp. HHNYT27 TaxID=3402275 RepID=UPI003EBB1B6D